MPNDNVNTPNPSEAREIAKPICDMSAQEYRVAAERLRKGQNVTDYRFNWDLVPRMLEIAADWHEYHLTLLTRPTSTPPDAWQTIESAPENHLPILVWREQYGRSVAFRDVTWEWYSLPMARPLLQPTHWQPLPGAPT